MEGKTAGHLTVSMVLIMVQGSNDEGWTEGTGCGDR